jgi:hypothetical protein
MEQYIRNCSTLSLEYRLCISVSIGYCTQFALRRVISCVHDNSKRSSTKYEKQLGYHLSNMDNMLQINLAFLL